MSIARTCVLKVGGSLLASAGFSGRLRAWLATCQQDHPDTHFVLVIGGGKLVDAVREIDVRTPLDVGAAHWICVALMDVTARLVGTMLSELTVVDQFAVLKNRLFAPGVSLFQPSAFLVQVEPSRTGTPLDVGWSVTSDAIAGRLAVILNADELVLLKSCAPPRQGSGADWLNALAAAGYIDGYLPRLASELPAVRCIDFSPERLTK